MTIGDSACAAANGDRTQETMRRAIQAIAAIEKKMDDMKVKRQWEETKYNLKGWHAFDALPARSSLAMATTFRIIVAVLGRVWCHFGAFASSSSRHRPGSMNASSRR